MKKSIRKTSSRAVLSLSLAWLGLLGSLSAGAAENTATSDAGASCYEEMRRATVWPTGSPKSAKLPRFEMRAVTVCNGKVVSQSSRNASPRANEQG